MSQVVGLPNYSYKPITNTLWVLVQLCKLQKGCTRLAAAGDKVYQLLAHGRWFSASPPTSPTTKTGRHDIAEILLKVALSNNHPLIQLQNNIMYNIPSSVSSQCCSYYCIYLYNPDPVTRTTNYPDYRRNKYHCFSPRIDQTGNMESSPRSTQTEENTLTITTLRLFDK